jgi:hypothetical protein
MRVRRPIIAVTAIFATATIYLSLQTAPQTAPRATPAAAPASTSTLPRVAGKPDFSGIWQANNTANWDLQTHQARPLIAQPGLTGNPVLAAPVVGLGTMG